MELTAADRSAVDARFWPRVDKTATCWLWTGYRYQGYGKIMWHGRNAYAHRVSFEIANGPIPAGLLVDHICHQRSCVNPAHLRLATNKQNGENRAPESLKGRLGVRDVHLRHGLRKPYRVSVGHNGRNVHGGYFATLGEAEQAAITLRARLFTHGTNAAEGGRR